MATLEGFGAVAYRDDAAMPDGDEVPIKVQVSAVFESGEQVSTVVALAVPRRRLSPDALAAAIVETWNAESQSPRTVLAEQAQRRGIEVVAEDWEAFADRGVHLTVDETLHDVIALPAAARLRLAAGRDSDSAYYVLFAAALVIGVVAFLVLGQLVGLLAAVITGGLGMLLLSGRGR